MNLKQTLAAVFLTFTAAGAATAMDLSVELYGGAFAKQSLNQNGTDYGVDIGRTFGGAIYTPSPIANLSYGLDVSYGKRQYIGYDEWLTTFAATSVVRYEMPATDKITAYAGLGVGVTRTIYNDNGTKYNGTKGIGQISLGARYTLGSGDQVFGEIKRHRGFSAVNVGGNAQEVGGTSVVFGYRHNF